MALAALAYAKSKRQHILSVVNVPESAMARASDLTLRTLAGPEIGVASTKAFTTQLAVLACLAIAARHATNQLAAFVGQRDAQAVDLQLRDVRQLTFWWQSQRALQARVELARLVFAALTPLMGAAAFAYDGIYIGATWTRPMRDLMVLAFVLYAAIVFLLHDLGNTGLWTAFLAFLALRGLGQAALAPRLTRRSFDVRSGPPR